MQGESCGVWGVSGAQGEGRGAQGCGTRGCRRCCCAPSPAAVAALSAAMPRVVEIKSKLIQRLSNLMMFPRVDAAALGCLLLIGSGCC